MSKAEASWLTGALVSLFWVIVLVTISTSENHAAALKDRFMEKCVTQGGSYRECLEVVEPRK